MSDALERLKNRKRPTVPDRDASIASGGVPPSNNLDTSISGSLDTSISGYPDMSIPSPTSIPPLQASPQVGNEEEPSLEIKQSTLRLERSLSDRLKTICREQKICREVLIEALFEYGEAHPEALQVAIATAQIKQEQRQQAANLKRAKAMMGRFR
jgi:hypothetical protein